MRKKLFCDLLNFCGFAFAPDVDFTKESAVSGLNAVRIWRTHPIGHTLARLPVSVIHNLRCQGWGDIFGFGGDNVTETCAIICGDWTKNVLNSIDHQLIILLWLCAYDANQQAQRKNFTKCHLLKNTKARKITELEQLLHTLSIDHRLNRQTIN